MSVRNTNKLLKSHRLTLFLTVAAISLAAIIYLTAADVYSPGGGPPAGQNPAGFNKQLYSLGTPPSIWVVVNKGRQLPADYVPEALTVPNVSLRFSAQSPEMMLRQDAAAALSELFRAAEAESLPLILTSGYRSYASQASIYNRNVSHDGQAATDAVSARPGHSEHQTGLAADVGAKTRKCELEKCFGSLPEGQWVAGNAHKYGFTIRYAQAKNQLTGYDYEPWHLRYVGKELAAELYRTGMTMEQFFDLETYSDYPATIQMLH